MRELILLLISTAALFAQIPAPGIGGGGSGSSTPDAVTGAAALSTTGIIPFTSGAGALAEDQYFTYKVWPSPAVAGTTYNRVNITDSAPPTGGYYDTNAGYDLSIRRTYTALPYTPSAPVVNSIGGIYLHQSFNFGSAVASDFLSSIHGEVEVPAASSQAVSYLEGLVMNVANAGSGNVSAMDGLYFSAFNNGAAAGQIRGIYGGAAHFGTSNATSVAGITIEGYNSSATVVTTNTGAYIYSGMGSGGGSITTEYGVRNRVDTTGTIGTAYGYQSTRIGSTAPTTAWDISAETGFNSRILGKLAVGPANSTAPSQTLNIKDATPTTGATSVLVDIGAGQSSTSTVLTLNGVMKLAGENTTGSGSASLGSNSPAVTNSAPYTWARVVTSDGSTGYIPIFK